MSEENGNGQIYARFGPGPTQVIPLEWCEYMMQAWRTRSPAQFGKALAEAAIEAAGS